MWIISSTHNRIKHVAYALETGLYKIEYIKYSLGSLITLF